jgi:hypothetical protein
VNLQAKARLRSRVSSSLRPGVDAVGFSGWTAGLIGFALLIAGILAGHILLAIGFFALSMVAAVMPRAFRFLSDRARPPDR